MWDIMGNICERTQDNLWGLYMEYLWEIFLWAQSSLWAYVGIYFYEWANEIRARKFVPRHLEFLLGSLESTSPLVARQVSHPRIPIYDISNENGILA